MKKMLFILTMLFITGCSSTKVINGKEQTFTEYVLLNKYAREGNVPDTGNMLNDWAMMNEECFPVIRWQKWNATK